MEKMMTQAAVDNEQTFAKLVAKAGWSIDRLTWRLRDTFRDIPWQGKDVLEIGCGRADLSLFMALHGARRVVALEPSVEGSHASKEAALRERLERLHVPNFTFLPSRFEDCSFEPESFDLVFLIQVIEHIHETHLALEDDPAALADYRRFFAEVFRVLRPGGVLLLTDYSRSNVWRLLQKVFGPQFKGPLTKVIDWGMHQHPRTWQRLAREAGFARTRLWWRVYQQMRRVPWLVDNRFVQYFAYANFVFSASKAGGEGNTAGSVSRPGMP
jgi:SAM-dependent methyltransferase